VDGDNASIDSGLRAGENVVIDGVDKLQQGSKVEARVVGAGSKGGEKTRPGDTR